MAYPTTEAAVARIPTKLPRTVDWLREQVHLGRWADGGGLPPERELALQLGISRVTVRAALRRLADDGLIVRRQGQGTFLAAGAATRSAVLDPRVVHLVYRQVAPGEFLQDPFVLQILCGLHEGIAACGMPLALRLLRVPPGETLMDRAAATPALVGKGIWLLEYHASAAEAAWLRERGHVLVSFAPQPSTAMTHVDIDNRSGGYLATRHLLASGRRRIAFIGGASTDLPTAGRYAGYVQAHRESRIEVDPALRREAAGWSDEDGAAAIRQLLAEGVRFDAAITCGDWATWGAYNVLVGSGLRIPDDVAIVMYDAYAWVIRLVKPTLTAVHQPVREMAAAAAELLAGSLTATGQAVTVRMLSPTLVVGRSSGGG